MGQQLRLIGHRLGEVLFSFGPDHNHHLVWHVVAKRTTAEVQGAHNSVGFVYLVAIYINFNVTPEVLSVSFQREL